MTSRLAVSTLILELRTVGGGTAGLKMVIVVIGAREVSGGFMEVMADLCLIYG